MITDIHTEHGEHCHTHAKKCISWSGILAGAIAAVGLAFLFHLLTLGIGLSALSSTVNGLATLAVGTFIWMFIGSYIILFVGGWIAGRVARGHYPHACHGVIHGFLTWAVALVLSIVLTSQMAEATALEVTSSPSMVMVNANANNNVNGATNNDNRNDNRQVISNQTQETIHKAGFLTLSTFFIALAAALGGCVGGYCGIRGCGQQTEGKNTPF